MCTTPCGGRGEHVAWHWSSDRGSAACFPLGLLGGLRRHTQDVADAYACGDQSAQTLSCHVHCSTRLLSPSALPKGRGGVGAAARVHIGGAPAARKTSHHERTLAVGAPLCSLPLPGTLRRTAPLGDGLAQLARRSPRTRCLWFVRCLFFCSPEALSACGLLELATCTEAVSRLIHRA